MFISEVLINPAKAMRTAQQTTLFDGKLINKTALDTDMWCAVSGGAATLNYSNKNRVLMTVTGSGDYAIYQSNRFLPYFSGKVQDIEGTFFSFKPEPGVIKRFGYASRTAVAPYAAEIDGVYIESNGDENTVKLMSANKGVITSQYKLPPNAIDSIPDQNWDNFNVVLMSLLWLGGASLELAQAFAQGFKVVAANSIVGNLANTICECPNQPVFYEIRSTGGAGTFTAICNQVATSGSINESGRGRMTRNVTSVSCPIADTAYLICAVRRNAGFRNLAILIDSIEGVLRTKDDAGTLFIVKNPTLTGDALVWTAHESGEYDEAFATNQTATALGRLIDARNMTSSGMSDTALDMNFMAWLTMDIQNVADIFALIYRPETANQHIKGMIHVKTY